MPVLAVGKTVEQGRPALLVENKLALGRHRFSLVVVDGRGIASEPVTLLVTVRKPLPIGPDGRLGGLGRVIGRRSPQGEPR